MIRVLIRYIASIFPPSSGFLLSHGQRWLQSPSTQRAETLLYPPRRLQGTTPWPGPESQLEDSYLLVLYCTSTVLVGTVVATVLYRTVKYSKDDDDILIRYSYSVIAYGTMPRRHAAVHTNKCD